MRGILHKRELEPVVISAFLLLILGKHKRDPCINSNHSNMQYVSILISYVGNIRVLLFFFHSLIIFPKSSSILFFSLLLSGYLSYYCKKRGKIVQPFDHKLKTKNEGKLPDFSIVCLTS